MSREQSSPLKRSETDGLDAGSSDRPFRRGRFWNTQMAEIYRPLMYTLTEDGKPVPCDDTEAWGRWFQNGDNRILQQDRIGGLLVSTVFLGLDHGFSEQPVLWEAMVFGGTDRPDGMDEEIMCRYTSREDALRGHKGIVQSVRERQSWRDREPCDDD